MKTKAPPLAALSLSLLASCSTANPPATESVNSSGQRKGTELRMIECSANHSRYVECIRDAGSQDELDEYSSKAHKERQAMLYEMSYLSSKGYITQDKAQEWYGALKASALSEETAYKEAARRVMALEARKSTQ